MDRHLERVATRPQRQLVAPRTAHGHLLAVPLELILVLIEEYLVIFLCAQYVRNARLSDQLEVGKSPTLQRVLRSV